MLWNFDLETRTGALQVWCPSTLTTQDRSGPDRQFVPVRSVARWTTVRARRPEGKPSEADCLWTGSLGCVSCMQMDEAVHVEVVVNSNTP